MSPHSSNDLEDQKPAFFSHDTAMTPPWHHHDKFGNKRLPGSETTVRTKPGHTDTQTDVHSDSNSYWGFKPPLTTVSWQLTILPWTNAKCQQYNWFCSVMARLLHDGTPRWSRKAKAILKRCCMTSVDEIQVAERFADVQRLRIRLLLFIAWASRENF